MAVSDRPLLRRLRVLGFSVMVVAAVVVAAAPALDQMGVW